MDIQQQISLACERFELENEGQKEMPRKILATCHAREAGSCLFCEKSNATNERKAAESWVVKRERNLLKGQCLF